MRLLETLQEYDFDVEYYPGARNYIQDALSRRPDYKKSPIPRVLATRTAPPPPEPQPITPAPPLPSPPPTTELLPAEPLPAEPLPAELLSIMASGVQANEWLDRLKNTSPARTLPMY